MAAEAGPARAAEHRMPSRAAGHALRSGAVRHGIMHAAHSLQADADAAANYGDAGLVPSAALPRRGGGIQGFQHARDGLHLSCKARYSEWRRGSRNARQRRMRHRHRHQRGRGNTGGNLPTGSKLTGPVTPPLWRRAAAGCPRSRSAPLGMDASGAGPASRSAALQK